MVARTFKEVMMPPLLRWIQLFSRYFILGGAKHFVEPITFNIYQSELPFCLWHPGTLPQSLTIVLEPSIRTLQIVGLLRPDLFPVHARQTKSYHLHQGCWIYGSDLNLAPRGIHQQERGGSYPKEDILFRTR